MCVDVFITWNEKKKEFLVKYSKPLSIKNNVAPINFDPK